MNRLRLIFLAALVPLLSQAQGLVNVSNRGLGLVFDPAGWPLTGTNYVAEIVYGPNSDSMTNLLGAPMPFRTATTSNPGTWDPGSEDIRTLNGFAEGQSVWMLVRVWDSEVFSSWTQAAAVLTAGVSIHESFAGAFGFEYHVGHPDNPASLRINNFQGFYLTYVGCPCELPCYSTPAPVKVGIMWNGGEAHLNLIPLLETYLSTNRPVSAPRWTADTPVERLFWNWGGNRHFEVSGTLGSARFVTRTNMLGDVSIPLSADIGYRSYVTSEVRRVCGVRAGLMTVRIYRPPQLVLLPRVADRIPIRLDGVPNTTYRILRSDRPGNFSPWATVVTDAEGSFPGMSFFDRDGQPDAVFLKAEEISR